jgi:hypothetical protein
MLQHLDDPAPPIYGADHERSVHQRGAQLNQRRRRRRGVLGGAVLAITAIAVVVASLTLLGARPRHVIVGGGPTSGNTLPASCAGGRPATGADARIGAAVTFGWLPSGYVLDPHPAHVLLLGPFAGITVAGTAGPSPRQIQASYLINSVAKRTVQANSTVNGHPAHITSSADISEVTWEQTPYINIVIRAPIDRSDLRHVADAASFKSGVTTPSVGDLGPVVSRGQAVTEATSFSSGEEAQPVGSVVGTWLVARTELSASRITELNPTSAGWNDPAWIIEFVTPTHQWTLDAVDALNDTAVAVIGPSQVPPAGLADLVDHSQDSPCPSPPSAAGT